MNPCQNLHLAVITLEVWEFQQDLLHANRQLQGMHMCSYCQGNELCVYPSKYCDNECVHTAPYTNNCQNMEPCVCVAALFLNLIQYLFNLFSDLYMIHLVIQFIFCLLFNMMPDICLLLPAYLSASEIIK